MYHVDTEAYYKKKISHIAPKKTVRILAYAC